MAYPYDALEKTLGRPLTAAEQAEAAGSQTPTPGAAAWPAPTTPPPAYTAPTFGAPAPYTPPTAATLAQDPSYQWRFDQGQQAYETGAAAKGTLRTGGAMKDLVAYGQNMASQEYAAADARAKDAYGLNFGVAKDVYDRNADASAAAYAPSLLGWQTQTANDQRNAELQFDRDWQQEIYNRDDAFRQQTYNTDDAYRKMVYMNDDSFRKVVYGTDDAFRKAVEAESDVWKRQVMEEERRRWMAELGAQ